MKILVTGGGGYIGCVLVSELLASGFEVTVVDSFKYQQNTLSHLCYYESLSIVKQDVRNFVEMQKLYTTHDCIIPLAAIVGAPACNALPVVASEVNKKAIFEMLNVLSNDQLVVMPTTNSAYGKGEAGNHCTEETALNPISHYAVEKVEVEKRILDHPNAVSFRLATVFGMSPRMRLDLLVNDFTYRAYNESLIVLFESSFKRNYVHVSDVARAVCFALNNYELFSGRVFNLGLDDANLTKLELANLIKRFVPNLTIIENQFGKDIDQRDYVVSNARLLQTGFKAKTSLENGIKELLRGFPAIKNSRYDNL